MYYINVITHVIIVDSYSDYLHALLLSWQLEDKTQSVDSLDLWEYYILCKLINI
jgi:hypothetical protein